MASHDWDVIFHFNMFPSLLVSHITQLGDAQPKPFLLYSATQKEIYVL